MAAFLRRFWFANLLQRLLDEPVAFLVELRGIEPLAS
jgi:hypothetical protein